MGPASFESSLASAGRMCRAELFDEAIIVCRDLISLHGEHPDIFKQLSEIHSRKGNHALAINFASRMIDTRNEISPEDYFILGRSYFFATTWLDAINQFSIVIKLEESDNDSHYTQSAMLYRASCYIRTRQFIEASRDLSGITQPGLTVPTVTGLISVKTLTDFLRCGHLASSRARI